MELKITLGLLLARTGYEADAQVLATRAFSDVRVWSPDAQRREDVCYIADARDARQSGYCCLVASSERSECAILTEDAASVVAGALRNELARLDKWCALLEQLSAFGGECIEQKMVTLTNELHVFDVPVALLDPGLRVVAGTEGVEKEELYTCLSRRPRGRALRTEDDPGLTQSGNYRRALYYYEPGVCGNRYAQLHLSFDIAGDTAAELIAVYTHGEMQSADGTLLKTLGHYLRQSVLNADNNSGTSRASFLCDALTHYLLVPGGDSEKDEQDWRARAAEIGMRFDGSFHLVAVTPAGNARVSANTVEATLPGSVTFAHDGTVLSFLSLGENDRYGRKIDELLGQAEKTARKSGLFYCVSHHFDCLQKIASAYEQCVQVAKTALRLQNNAFLRAFALENPFQDQWVYRYRDCFEYVAFLELSERRRLSPPCDPALLELCHGESRGDRNAVRVLYTYLQNRCSPTETAKVLYMHRNNVSYHIAQLRERWDWDLDAVDMQFRFRMTFRYLMMTWGEEEAEE